MSCVSPPQRRFSGDGSVFRQRRIFSIKVYDMKSIARIFAAVALVFALAAPAMAAFSTSEQLASQVQKKKDQQSQTLVRNWGG